MSTQCHVFVPKSLLGCFENKSHCLIWFSLGYHVTTKCVSRDLRWCLEQWEYFTGYVTSQLCCICNGEYVALAFVCSWQWSSLPGFTIQETQLLPSIPGKAYFSGLVDCTCFSFMNDLCNGLHGQLHPRWAHLSVAADVSWPHQFTNSSPFHSQSECS